MDITLLLFNVLGYRFMDFMVNVPDPIQPFILSYLSNGAVNIVKEKNNGIQYVDIKYPPKPPKLKLNNSSDKVISCAIDASKKYQLPTALLLAVSSQEAGKPGIRVQNSNVTFDVGYMQFNTSYIRTLNQFNIHEEDLNKDNCYPFEVAAWRIKKHVMYDNGDIFTKVLNYHSKTPYYNSIYRAKIIGLTKSWHEYLISVQLDHVQLSNDIINSETYVSTNTTSVPINNKKGKAGTKKKIEVANNSSKIDLKINKKDVKFQEISSKNNTNGFSSKIDMSNLYKN